jgi:protein-ribulosamine 3-kinase
MMNEALEAAAAALGGTATSAEAIGGGSIASAWRLKLADGRSFFVKTGYPEPAMYEAEAEGLRELATCRAIRVPAVVAVGQNSLVLEYIPRGVTARNFSEILGRGLAEMHRVEGKAFGFRGDNFIGTTPQRNTPELPRAAGWAEFFWKYRLLPQWELATAKGHVDPRMQRMFIAMEGRLADWLGPVDEPPVLLHGDLWGGNAITDGAGLPVLIDPAVYYGHRETDLAMMRLFGGLPERVFKSYLEIHPVAAGAQERKGIYQLYHLLNHLNLFGASYLDQVTALLNRHGR